MGELALFNKFYSCVEQGVELLIKNSKEFPEYRVSIRKILEYEILRHSLKDFTINKKIEVLMLSYIDVFKRTINNYNKSKEKNNLNMLENSLEILSDYTLFTLNNIQKHLEK